LTALARLRLRVVAVTVAVASAAQAASSVRVASYRVASGADPGSAQVLLRNAGAAPLRISKALLDGRPLPVFGVAGRTAERRAGRVVWASFSPNPIPSGRSGLLHVQFRRRPAYPFRLRFVSRGSVIGQCKIGPAPPPARMTRIAFSCCMHACLVYVANAGEDALEVRSVELNDQQVTGRTWFSSRRIGPGAKGLLVIPKPRVEVGQGVTVVIGFGSGLRIVGRVRALPVFPVVMETGGARPELGVTMSHVSWAVGPPGAAASSAPTRDDTVEAVRLFHCPSHLWGGDWPRVAREILRRRAVMNERQPQAATYAAVCRAQAEVACPVFAHTADAGFLNPCLPQYSHCEPPRSPDALWSGMELLRRSSAPMPCFALVSDRSFGDAPRPASATELRRRLYAVLAAGAGGVVYRFRGGAPSPSVAECVRRANARIERITDLLLVAEPVSWAASSNPQVHARVLLAGRSGLVLFLLNAGGAGGVLSPAGPAEATVALPRWLGAIRLAGESDPIAGTVRVECRRVRVRVSRLASARMLVFRTDAAAGADAPSLEER
jgi:hypothetical protein